jgi:hypothetical protein
LLPRFEIEFLRQASIIDCADFTDLEKEALIRLVHRYYQAKSQYHSAEVLRPPSSRTQEQDREVAQLMMGNQLSHHVKQIGAAILNDIYRFEGCYEDI